MLTVFLNNFEEKITLNSSINHLKIVEKLGKLYAGVSNTITLS